MAEILKGMRFVVIGVDVWLPTKPGPTIPTPFIYDRKLDASERAVEFIRDFKWADEDVPHQGLEPYFNFTVIKLDS